VTYAGKIITRIKKGLSMNESPFNRFIQLVHYDQEIHTLKQTIERLEREILELQNHAQSVRLQSEEIKQEILQWRKVVDENELRIKEYEQQAKDRKKHLDNASNNKQYEALKSEVSQLNRAQHDLEPVVFEAWQRLEAAQERHAIVIKENGAVLATDEKAVEEKQQEIAQLHQSIVHKKKERHSKTVDIPTEWLEKYEVMGTRVPDPVVPVEVQACTACFTQLTSQEMIMLKRGALLQCKRCFRLLYLPDSTEQAL
jgi:uncharacterized protein